ncbi:hypothetical protein D3C87_273860 [compost metagenome]
MNTFVVEPFYVDDNNACNFYTVRFDDQEISETDKFYDRFYQSDNEYLEDMQIIHALIEELAISGTSIIRRSRDESRAFALPPELIIKDCKIDVFGNKLRLYYVELAANVLVLLGGGVAHDENNGKVPIQFQEAQLFAKKILDEKAAYQVIKGKLIPVGDEEIIIN